MGAAVLPGCSCSEAPGERREPPVGIVDSALATEQLDSADTAALPDTAPPEPEPWIDVAAGLRFTIGIRESGTIEFWGYAGHFDEPPPGGQFVEVIAGETFACALDVAGAAACWGCAGDLPPVDSTSPCKVPPGTYSALYRGLVQACAVSATSGELVCWGNLPPAPPEAPLDPDVVSVGVSRACVVEQAGSAAICWGLDWLPDWVVQPPTDVQFADMALGSVHGCGLDLDGYPHCWGTGTLVSGMEAENEAYPQCPFEGPFEAVETNNRDTCVIDADGYAQCWTATTWSYPALDPPDVPFTKVSVGSYHGCGLTPEGEILCFGEGGYGELDVPE